MFDQFRTTPGYWKKDVQNFVLQILQILMSEEKTLASKIPQAAEEDLDQYVQQVPSLSQLQDFMEAICDLYLQEVQNNQPYSRLVQDVLHYIEGHCSNPALNVSVIADYFHFSNTHMNALFKQETGVTLKKYIINYRLELSKSMLRNKHYKINEIAARCGYANGNYFSKVFKAETGMVPNDYRKKYL